MKSILEKLKPSVDGTIKRLSSADFKTDPIAGKQFSRIPSVIGSMQKRHGLIVEEAIFEALSTYSHYSVWTEDKFKVSGAVNTATSNVNNVKANPD